MITQRLWLAVWALALGLSAVVGILAAALLFYPSMLAVATGWLVISWAWPYLKANT